MKKIVLCLFLVLNFSTLPLIAMNITLEKISLIRSLSQQSHSYISQVPPYLRIRLTYFCTARGCCMHCGSLLLINYQHFCTSHTLDLINYENNHISNK